MGLVVLGAIVMIGPTFGFATIGADRSVSVSTAEDPDGLLGIETVYDGSEIVYDDGDGTSNDESVVTVANNLGSDITDFDVQLVSIDGVSDGVLGVENRQDLFDGIGTNDSPIPVILECTRDEQAQSDGADVALRLNAIADSVSVTEKTVVVPGVSVDCDEDDVDRVEQEPGTPVDDAATVELDDAFASAPRGNTAGTVTFVFTNTDSGVLTIEALEIRSSSQAATIGLDKPGNQAQVRVDSGDTTGEISSSQVVRFGDGGVRTDGPVPVAVGDTAEITMENFVDIDSTGNQGLDMAGEDVTVVLYFEGDQPAIAFELNDLRLD